jgi:dihydroorotate dehydrogenase electron transfer subunit
LWSTPCRIRPMPPSRSRNQFTATVYANKPLCRDHFRLVLTLPQFPPTAPGHFIQIACDDVEKNAVWQSEIDWQPENHVEFQNRELLESRAVLRRPFSLAGRRDLAGRVELDIIHRVVGLGTHWLANLKVGDTVGILGPLGNTFVLPEPGGHALLVGGGVGIPPMLYLANHLAAQSAGCKAVAFAGAVTRDLLPLTIIADAAGNAEPRNSIAEFSEHGIASVITTDDGSFGYRGFVTQALETYLDSPAAQTAPPPILYTCGPEPMMKRVADIALRRNLQCQVAVERAMACGMGTCQSCCIRVKKKEPAKPPLPGRDWCYRLACTDGPIFQAAELLW